jgi:hypothetical protein
MFIAFLQVLDLFSNRSGNGNLLISVIFYSPLINFPFYIKGKRGLFGGVYSFYALTT